MIMDLKKDLKIEMNQPSSTPASNRHSLPRGSQPRRALAMELLPTPLSPTITILGSGNSSLETKTKRNKETNDVGNEKYMFIIEH